MAQVGDDSVPKVLRDATQPYGLNGNGLIERASASSAKSLRRPRNGERPNGKGLKVKPNQTVSGVLPIRQDAAQGLAQGLGKVKSKPSIGLAKVSPR